MTQHAHVKKRLYDESDLETVGGRTVLKKSTRKAPSCPVEPRSRVNLGQSSPPVEIGAYKSNAADSPFRSKWEAAFAQQLDLEIRAGLVKAWCYEPISFKLAEGKRYRPDFLVQYPDGLEKPLTFFEIKGQWTKNRRDGLTHLKWAAQLYPMFAWVLVWREGGKWESATVRV